MAAVSHGGGAAGGLRGEAVARGHALDEGPDPAGGHRRGFPEQAAAMTKWRQRQHSCPHFTILLNTAHLSLIPGGRWRSGQTRLLGDDADEEDRRGGHRSGGAGLTVALDP